MQDRVKLRGEPHCGTRRLIEQVAHQVQQFGSGFANVAHLTL